MSVKTFMASMMQTVVSGWTTEPTETNGGESGALRGVKGADHRALDDDALARRGCGGAAWAGWGPADGAVRRRPVGAAGGWAGSRGGRGDLGPPPPQADLIWPSIRSIAVRSYRFISRTRWWILLDVERLGRPGRFRHSCTPQTAGARFIRCLVGAEGLGVGELR